MNQKHSEFFCGIIKKNHIDNGVILIAQFKVKEVAKSFPYVGRLNKQGKHFQRKDPMCMLLITIL